jgi:hypothetical protein
MVDGDDGSWTLAELLEHIVDHELRLLAVGGVHGC